MKIYLQVLAFIVITLIPASIIAQESVSGTIQKPAIKFYSANDSVTTKQNLQITSILASKPQTAFPFQYYLQTRLLNKNKNIYIEQPEIVQYNMPILKPEKTSKILLAKLDADFPYSYNMPVKNPVGEK